MIDDVNIIRFNLISPLYYVPLLNADPFFYKEDYGESLFCFELNESQRLSIEPDKNILLGTMLFGGKAAQGSQDNKSMEGNFLELPAGHYLFVQKRELLSREGIIDMAAELQMEGLWQRLKIGEKLYLRYLFEDGSVVTQLFREIKRCQSSFYSACGSGPLTAS